MTMGNFNDKLAHVAINKSILKEYSNSSNERIVYMNDNTEFQIQIFNPYSYVIGVSFSFNGANNDNSNILVLRPGERVWLDRHMCDDSKLMFSTYSVDNSYEAQNAIANNGEIYIKFFKEQQSYNYDQSIYVSNRNLIMPYYYLSSPNDFNTTITTSSVGSPQYSSDIATTYSINNTSSIETGRIEKGNNKSSIIFKNVYKDFEYWPFTTEIIKIMPKSTKQISAKDLQKRYCHNCGRKLNQKFKFCPYCGSKQ